MNIVKAVISAIFPNICAGCGQVLDGDEYFCDYCFEMLEHCHADKICRKCGLPKKLCECGKYIFHFDACAAAFRNDGIAKKAMYAFKFRHKERLARYFAEQMALMVSQRYADRKFDYIAYVPMTRIRALRRGYNQSYILAKELSGILKIPLGVGMLGCSRDRRKTQHKLSRKDRFQNIKGKYFCDVRLDGKNILLVDDIKTTGATFDECSKQLFAAGAGSVCCIAGLITYNKKKEEKNNGN